MNIKFRMPRFRKRDSAKGVVREMLMTIIATSISIVLTFGTGIWLDYRQKVKDSRQMAMMVIHDMDENIEAMNNEAKKERRDYAAAYYVLEHLDQIESLSEDTLSQVWAFLATGNYGSSLVLDESNEQIFNSSQETWKVLDNPTFVNLVQQFYSQRRHFMNFFKNDISFRKPISPEQERELQIKSGSETYDVLANPTLMRTLLTDMDIKYYIDWAVGRADYYETIASEWKHSSDQAKFIMGITDEELNEFIEEKNRRGEHLSEKEICGKWRATSAKGENTEYIIFRRDHTFTHHTTTHINLPIWTGDALRHHYLTGTWRMEGDSLIRDYDKGHRYELDFSQITYAREMKDSVEHVIDRSKKDTEELNERIKDTPFLGRKANLVTIDKSGNKVEMARMVTDEDGKETIETSYMTRVKH